MTIQGLKEVLQMEYDRLLAEKLALMPEDIDGWLHKICGFNDSYKSLTENEQRDLYRKFICKECQEAYEYFTWDRVLTPYMQLDDPLDSLIDDYRDNVEDCIAFPEFIDILEYLPEES